jgi:hypothetical protein
LKRAAVKVQRKEEREQEVSNKNNAARVKGEDHD